MSSPSNDGSQFKAEAQVLDDEERYARELLDRKYREREAKKQREEAEAPEVINEEVIRPEDDALHMELAKHAEERKGEMFDTRNGELLQWNEDGLLRYAPKWEHRTVTYKGTTWQYRDPKKLAMMFMAASTNTKTSPERRINGMIEFLGHTLSERSLDHMRDRANDYDDEFDTEEMARLLQFITSKVEGDQDQAALEREKKQGELK